MWNLKIYNRLVNITTTKENRLKDTENKPVVTAGIKEGGRGNIRVRY